MKVIKTELPEVLIIEPDVYRDDRGFFLETWHTDRYREAGIGLSFPQANHSRSIKGVLRGLHYQVGPRIQAKLVEVVRGEVFDVAVDIRQGSPTFGRWVGVRLDDRTRRQFLVPAGFAHGFYVISEEADFVYRCSDYYDPAGERALRWDDPDLAVEWPPGPRIISEKDRTAPFLKALTGDLPPYP